MLERRWHRCAHQMPTRMVDYMLLLNTMCSAAGLFVHHCIKSITGLKQNVVKKKIHPLCCVNYSTCCLCCGQLCSASDSSSWKETRAGWSRDRCALLMRLCSLKGGAVAKNVDEQQKR